MTNTVTFQCDKCGTPLEMDPRTAKRQCACGGWYWQRLLEDEEPAVLQMSNESDNPDHYKTNGVECIDAMRAMLGDDGFVAYIRGTIFKYNWRLGRKDESEMEAKKIAVYTRWLGDALAGKELSK